jgi:hypothetical protein
MDHQVPTLQIRQSVRGGITAALNRQLMILFVHFSAIVDRAHMNGGSLFKNCPFHS